MSKLHFPTKLGWIAIALAVLGFAIIVYEPDSSLLRALAPVNLGLGGTLAIIGARREQKRRNSTPS